MRLILLLALITLSAASYATKPKPPEKDDIEQNQNQDQAQTQGQAQAQGQAQTATGGNVGDITVGGNTYRGGDTTVQAPNVSNDLVIQGDKTFAPAELGENCIGSACRSVTSGYVEVYQDSSDDFGRDRGIRAGIAIPLGGASRQVDSAMAYEAAKLRDRNLHDRERHQAEMMQVCLELHKLGVVFEDASPELWERCRGFEHHGPEDSGSIGRHAGHGNPRQVSPHDTQ